MFASWVQGARFKEGAWCLQVGFKEQGSRRVLGVCKFGSRSKVQGGC